MGLKRQSPYRSRGLERKGTMMRLVIILLILLIIAHPAY
ncbi:TPA: type I toxin-antitoxin system Ibs family toxin [Kluyvera ascorbata]|nr:type I toxin-antitoxin system Ibs family toxin [Kluyvera ascorbata]HAT3942962.1 type I toxin-antitoxin system Ibs family toxin [Kluyvera ascorbata]HAT3948208.1 type I toxin-antitoxin system Ibs family toxin [Kluyvera ascorbata]